MARLLIRAQPSAKREGFCGWFGDLPKFATRAAPIDGAANAALERGLATALGVPRRAVRLVGGGASRTKRFEVDGLDSGELDRAIRRLNPR
jgi:hypothetical protein